MFPRRPFITAPASPHWVCFHVRLPCECQCRESLPCQHLAPGLTHEAVKKPCDYMKEGVRLAELQVLQLQIYMVWHKNWHNLKVFSQQMVRTVETPIQTVGKYKGKHLRKWVRMKVNPPKGVRTLAKQCLHVVTSTPFASDGGFHMFLSRRVTHMPWELLSRVGDNLLMTKPPLARNELKACYFSGTKINFFLQHFNLLIFVNTNFTHLFNICLCSVRTLGKIPNLMT